MGHHDARDGLDDDDTLFALLAVETAIISLDGDELVSSDHETGFESTARLVESSLQPGNFLLRDLESRGLGLDVGEVVAQNGGLPSFNI